MSGGNSKNPLTAHTAGVVVTTEVSVETVLPVGTAQGEDTLLRSASLRHERSDKLSSYRNYCTNNSSKCSSNNSNNIITTNNCNCSSNNIITTSNYNSNIINRRGRQHNLQSTNLPRGTVPTPHSSSPSLVDPECLDPSPSSPSLGSIYHGRSSHQKDTSSSYGPLCQCARPSHQHRRPEPQLCPEA